MAKDLSKERAVAQLDYSRFDFKAGTESYEVILNKGLSEATVREISSIKDEPAWMLEFRLKALRAFNAMPMPQWGADLNPIKFDDIIYYMRASQANRENWEDVPAYIKNTFDRLGIPEAEKKFLGGVTAFALVVVGFDPIENYIGKKDLFGRQLLVTREARADQLATAANFLMGNADQAIPAVIVRGHGLPFSDFAGWVPGIKKEEDMFNIG